MYINIKEKKKIIDLLIKWCDMNTLTTVKNVLKYAFIFNLFFWCSVSSVHFDCLFLFIKLTFMCSFALIFRIILFLDRFFAVSAAVVLLSFGSCLCLYLFKFLEIFDCKTKAKTLSYQIMSGFYLFFSFSIKKIFQRCFS